MMRGLFTVLGLTVASPVLAAVSFVYYVGYRSTKWAFEHPKTTVALGAGVGLLWYAGSTQMHDRVHEFATMLRGRNTLEQRLADAERVQSWQQKHIQQLESTLEEYKRMPVQQEKPALASTDMQFNFYYVRMGESLGVIAHKVSGDPAAYATLVQDNGILDASQILAGQLLKVRKVLCKRDVEGLYAQIPSLQSVVLPGTVRISERFSNYEEVLDLNRKLGLFYRDEFPHKRGSRVVYYK
jgi:ElaB/YqjD/DUF883 family membrane-anchored ribosome-binding protein